MRIGLRRSRCSARTTEHHTVPPEVLLEQVPLWPSRNFDRNSGHGGFSKCTAEACNRRCKQYRTGGTSAANRASRDRTHSIYPAWELAEGNSGKDNFNGSTKMASELPRRIFQPAFGVRAPRPGPRIWKRKRIRMRLLQEIGKEQANGLAKELAKGLEKGTASGKRLTAMPQ